MNYRQREQAIEEINNFANALRDTAFDLGEHEPDAARATLIAGCNEAAAVLRRAVTQAQTEARGEAERKGDGRR